MKDMMIDIETLGSAKAISPIIIQIGACYFDRESGEIGQTFKENIDIQSCLNLGFETDGSAIEFWLKQPGRSFLEDPKPIYAVLIPLQEFSIGAKRVWAHATFDFPVLVNACKKTNTRIPFSFKVMRDIRTLVDLAGLEVKPPKDGKSHDALDDCIYQVGYCVKCLQILKTQETMVWQ